jgi:hypothetical protein
MRVRIVAVFVGGAGLVAACFGSSTSNPPPGPMDGGEPVVEASVEASAPAPVDGPVMEASQQPDDAGPVVDSSSDGNPLGCPGDVSSLAFVSVTVTEGTAPAFTGGAINNGEYVLTSATVYDSDGQFQTHCSTDAAVQGVERESLTFESGTGRADVQEQGQPALCGVSTYTLAGTMITLVQSTTGPVAYSVSSDGQTLYTPLLVAGGCTWARSSSPDGAAGPSGSYLALGTFTLQP